MTANKLIVFIGILLINFQGIAQQSMVYANDWEHFQKGLELYHAKQYHAAQTIFDRVKKDTEDLQIQSDCAYYMAHCAVRLEQNNADDLILDFVEDYPTSPKRNTAFLDVGDYYFANSKYARAKKWYDKVDERALSKAEQERFYFNYAYSLFSTSDENRAKTYFSKVENSKTYGSQAKYYIGYMAYEGDDYDKANTYFEQLQDQEKYQEKLSYYQADLNFKLGKFDKAITLAKEQLPKSNAEEVSELSKIIGESYFNLGQYQEAIPYLQDYKGKHGKWNNTDYYQLGYAYYKQNDYENAISEFNKIIGGNDGVAQNAYYHLGESYIHLDKKQEALNAFRNASQMDFDLKIQEDAWLNYAKISYEIGNPYQSVPQVLTGYLENYPNTAHREEIETLLIDSYITSKNYKEALDLLKGKRSFGNRVAYQKVTFYRGLELYNEGQYQDAKAMFESSIKEAKEPEFTARATYWQAETDYLLGNYNDALLGFKQFQQQAQNMDVPEKQNLDYNLAYTYFKLKNYNKANVHFQNFIASADDALRVNDAYLRLGDGYFSLRDYNQAINAYSQAIAIHQIESDYPAFQKAMSYGYMGESTKKIKGLQDFVEDYPKSALRDDAIYELGNTYVKLNQVSKGMTAYNKLISEHENSVFVPKVLLRQGLVYYNTNDYQKALSKLKKVAEQYPNTEEANQSVATVRLIYIDLGSVDEYATWVKTLDYINVTDSELDDTTYLAAEKQYLDNNSNKAIKQFNAYLSQFPNGRNALKAHFYVAELYAKDGLTETATPHYQYVVNQPKGEFTEQAMMKLSEIYLNESNWNEAVTLLKRLETEANYPQNVIYAKSNLMNAYYQLEDYEQAETYATSVLKHSKLDNKIKSDAKIIIARSAIKTGDEQKAKTTYAELETMASGALAAEALYYNAYFKHKEGQFEASNLVIQKLAKDFSSYKYFSAKGLVIMAKNFYALGDAFQATYILESVIDNFSDFEDVTAQAQTELQNIKAEEAKTNSSVQSDN